MEVGTESQSERDNSSISDNDSDCEQLLLGAGRGVTGAYESLFGGGFPADRLESGNDEEMSDGRAKPEDETSNADVNDSSTGLDRQVCTEVNTVESYKIYSESKSATSPISVSLESDSCLALLDQSYSFQPTVSGIRVQAKSQVQGIPKKHSGVKPAVVPSLQTSAGDLEHNAVKREVGVTPARVKALASADDESNTQREEFSKHSTSGAGTSQKPGSWKLQRHLVNPPTSSTASRSGVRGTNVKARLSSPVQQKAPVRQEKKSQGSGDKGEHSSGSSCEDEEGASSQLPGKAAAPRISRYTDYSVLVYKPISYCGKSV